MGSDAHSQRMETYLIRASWVARARARARALCGTAVGRNAALTEPPMTYDV
jgi:hypothetical protein